MVSTLPPNVHTHTKLTFAVVQQLRCTIYSIILTAQGLIEHTPMQHMLFTQEENRTGN